MYPRVSLGLWIKVKELAQIFRKLTRTTVLSASSGLSPIQLILLGTVLRSWSVTRAPKQSGS